MSEGELAPSWDGSVVLDIGGDVGALMLRTSSAMLGHEIELIPDDDAPRTHSAVRERQSPRGRSFAAVYPSLKLGTYSVEGSALRVAVVGGRVTDAEYDSDEAASTRPHSA
ncbi:MAG: phospholipase [Acidimicrobiales bacterium]